MLTGNSDYAELVRSSTRKATGQNLVPYGNNNQFLGSQWRASVDAKNWFYRKKSFVKFPSNIITDGDNAFSFPGTNTQFSHWALINRTAPIQNSRNNMPSSLDMLPDFREELNFPIGERHFAGANVVCLDGHVDWQMQIKWHAGANDHRWRKLDAGLVWRTPRQDDDWPWMVA